MFFFKKLIFEYDTIESHEIQTDENYYEKVRHYVSKIIRRYSHHQKKDDLEQYVLQKLPFREEPKKFVLDYPLKLINETKN